MTTYYKVLGPGRTAFHGGSGTWPGPGEWLEVEGEVVPCVNGLHLTDLGHLIEWLGPEIWEAEAHPDATVVEHGNKIAVSKARLVRRLDAWDERTARLFAADCAEHVLHLYERDHPGDDRPRRAIEAARAYADGRITADEMAAAWDAAWDAAQAAAAWAAAAWDAAWDAAAWDAEREWQTARLAHYLGIG